MVPRVIFSRTGGASRRSGWARPRDGTGRAVHRATPRDAGRTRASQGGGSSSYWAYSGDPTTRRGAVAVVVRPPGITGQPLGLAEEQHAGDRRDDLRSQSRNPQVNSLRALRVRPDPPSSAAVGVSRWCQTSVAHSTVILDRGWGRHSVAVAGTTSPVPAGCCSTGHAEGTCAPLPHSWPPDGETRVADPVARSRGLWAARTAP